jgi:bacterioferritin-associated ferredoxin
MQLNEFFANPCYLMTNYVAIGVACAKCSEHMSSIVDDWNEIRASLGHFAGNQNVVFVLLAQSGIYMPFFAECCVAEVKARIGAYDKLAEHILAGVNMSCRETRICARIVRAALQMMREAIRMVYETREIKSISCATGIPETREMHYADNADVQKILMNAHQLYDKICGAISGEIVRGAFACADIRAVTCPTLLVCLRDDGAKYISRVVVGMKY